MCMGPSIAGAKSAERILLQRKMMTKREVDILSVDQFPLNRSSAATNACIHCLFRIYVCQLNAHPFLLVSQMLSTMLNHLGRLPSQ